MRSHTSFVPSRPRTVALAFLLLGVLVVLLAGPPRARATFDGPAYAFPVPDYVTGLIGQSALDNAYRASGSGGRSGSSSSSSSKKPAKPKRPTARQRRTLRFTTTRGVTDRIHAFLVERTQQDPATIIPEFEKVVADWRRVMKTAARWSPRDLGDSAAFAFVQQYRLYHGQSTFNDKGLARLRVLVRDNLALQQSVRRLSAERKQEASEMLELRTIFFGGNLEGAKNSGDEAARRSTLRELQAFTEDTFGVDLRKVRITSKGLVRR